MPLQNSPPLPVSIICNSRAAPARGLLMCYGSCSSNCVSGAGSSSAPGVHIAFACMWWHVVACRCVQPRGCIAPALSLACAPTTSASDKVETVPRKLALACEYPLRDVCRADVIGLFLLAGAKSKCRLARFPQRALLLPGRNLRVAQKCLL